MILEIQLEGLMIMILFIYITCHLPAIIALIVGIVKRKKNPSLSKKLYIFSIIYFLIGGGICGSIL